MGSGPSSAAAIQDTADSNNSSLVSTIITLYSYLPLLRSWDTNSTLIKFENWMMSGATLLSLAPDDDEHMSVVASPHPGQAEPAQVPAESPHDPSKSYPGFFSFSPDCVPCPRGILPLWL